MPTVDSFTQAANAADAAARLRLTADDQVVAKGKSLKGRVVAWFKEVFGDGKAENRKAIGAFCQAVRSQYGAAAGDEVDQQLSARLKEGKPLCRRHVMLAYRCAEWEQNGGLGGQLADLSDGTPARGMVEDLVTDGVLSREGADALVRQFSPSMQLKRAIRQAVSAAQAKNPDRPLDAATALNATQRAVREAAPRIMSAENLSAARPRRSSI
jgi:hypothetical protein